MVVGRTTSAAGWERGKNVGNDGDEKENGYEYKGEEAGRVDENKSILG